MKIKETEAMAPYIVEQVSVQPEYCDDWHVVMTMGLRRDDGVTGDVWICAGVPDYQRGTARAAGHTRGLEDVWCYGDSPDTWCPDSFLHDDQSEILTACRERALAEWRKPQPRNYDIRAIQSLPGSGRIEDDTTVEAVSMSEARERAETWLRDEGWSGQVQVEITDPGQRMERFDVVVEAL